MTNSNLRLSNSPSSLKNGEVSSRPGFGTFKGVFIPSILTILGVIMYLRLGWVVGHAGMFGTALIVTLASAITFFTGLSIAATATNMKIKGGGAYFMVSRSFGIEAGAAIGVPLYFAQAIGVSFYISGFAESVVSIAPFLNPKLVALASLGCVVILAYISADLALKTQFVIFAIIIASLISFLLGHPLSYDTLPVPEVKPSTLSNPDFWQIFAVFFPAVTGIEAGISMSGDLKSPRKSLPIGTISAVVVGFLVYLMIPIMLVRFAPTDVLKNNPMVMKDVALFSPLIFLGIWGATLSSALGALLGGPRTLQALAQDRVVPSFLGKGFGKTNDPRIATAVTFAIAAGGVLLGDLDVIAPVLSMFFLTSYGSLNLIAGLEGLIGNPSWRPSFKLPWAISLIATFACFGVMMMIDAGSSFLAFFLVLAVYFLTRRRNLRAGWSDIRGGLLAFLARYSIYKLASRAQNARSWRPNLMVLSGSPTSRLSLIEFADALTHGKGFLTVASVLNSTSIDFDKNNTFANTVGEYLSKKSIPALVKVKNSTDFAAGVGSLFADYGLGAIAPNTILLGDSKNEDRIEEFCSIIKDSFAYRKNTLIFRHYRTERKRKPPKKRVIDVWWRRKHNNATLMLILGYMLQTSPEWRGSTLKLKTFVNDEMERRGVLDGLEQFIKESRFDAEIEVYVLGSDANPFAEIQRHSQTADLIFLGLLAPKPEESLLDYATYYKQILAETKNFPPTVLTLTGEKIALTEITV